MPGNKSYYIYRSLALYHPQGTTGLQPTINRLPSTAPAAYYNLQGQRVGQPSKGVYVKDNQKVLIK
jgi:hypothetical protein